MNCVFRIPISSRYSSANLAMNASVSLGASSGLKLSAMCPTGFATSGLSRHCHRKLRAVSSAVPSSTPSEAMISASSFCVT